MSRHRIVQSQPRARHHRQRPVDDISFVRMLEAWLRTVGTEHKHHCNTAVLHPAKYVAAPVMTILASGNVGLLHYLAGSPLQDRQDVLLMEATLEPAGSVQALKLIQRMDSCQSNHY